MAIIFGSVDSEDRANIRKFSNYLVSLEKKDLISFILSAEGKSLPTLVGNNYRHGQFGRRRL